MDGCWGADIWICRAIAFVFVHTQFLWCCCLLLLHSQKVLASNVEASYPHCDFLSFSSVRTQNARIAS